ncbi:hypothetical protein [Antrihabitans stalactiti]|jgi:Mce-associated membrane protein|uniref:Mce-associated membrane protein n=1 Tax=Antrihabitans stalactiti TaxID=2584121 RepID=A0A848KCG0_9NOCA|nr:hypothetical protein [Antrihabitans stalactiti]NMN95386.1 hypothetical protein [Antrihabitans stalactiti]
MADDVDIEDLEEDEEADEPTECEARKAWIPLALAGVVLVVGSVAATRAFWPGGGVSDDDSDAARQEFCTWARSYAAVDFNDLDTYFRTVLAGTSGDGKASVEKSSANNSLRDFLKQTQVKKDVKSADCGVVRVDGGRVDVVGVLAVSTSNIRGVVPEQIGLTATMQKDGDRWLVSKLDLPLIQG